MQKRRDREIGWTEAIVLFVLAMLVLFGGTACSATPMERVENENPEVAVTVITRFDDCTIYRVDAGTRLYVARCGRETFTEWDERHGRGRSRRVVQAVVE